MDEHLARSDGLAPEGAVRLSGLKVGEITGVALDLNSYFAIVHMNIRDGIKVPIDSHIEVTSDGLLGNPYLLIHPGRSKTMLPAGGMIVKGCGTADIMSLIGRPALMNGQSACGR